MATDTTTVASDSAIIGTPINESDIEQMHLTQSGGSPTAVQMPAGENAVRVPVTPGETIQLPFPADGLVARLGDNGNLAVKVGDVTVILLGYAEATGQSDVTIIGSDGIAVDVAAVLASTDPNLDIQTAAGPGAGDQGAGVDNNGGVFSPFDPAAGLGGLNAVGGLDPTALNYNLIENQNILYDPEDDTIEIDQTPVILSIGTALVNEDDFPPRQNTEAFYAYQGNDRYDSDDNEDNDGDGLPESTDGTGNSDDIDKESMVQLVKIDVDFFGEVPGDLKLLTDGLPLDWESNGNIIAWTVASDGHTLRGIADGLVVIEIKVTNAPSMDGHFDVTVELKEPLDHLEDGASPNIQDLLTANIAFQVIDSNGTTVEATFEAAFKDDVPFDAKVLYSEGSSEEEVPTAAGNVIDEDDLQAGDHDDAPGDDDVNAGLNATARVEGFVAVEFGGDGPALHEAPFRFDVADGADSPYKTSIGETILWDATDPTHIFGYVERNNVRVDIFEVSINYFGYFLFQLNEALQHEAPEDPNTGFENNLTLTLPVIATDNDGDTISTAIEINVDDDMPAIETRGQDSESDFIQLFSDETVRPTQGDVDGLGNGTPQDGPRKENDELDSPIALALTNIGAIIGHAGADLTDIFFTFDAGADGEKSHAYGLDILKSETALVDTLSGETVRLEKGPDGIVRGIVTANGQDETVFALVINASTGAVELAQYRAIDHGSDGAFSYEDEVLALGAGYLNATLTVTDNDDDTANSSFDIGKYIRFEDDGPSVGETQTAYFDDDLMPGGNPTDPASDDAPDAGDPLPSLDVDGHPYVIGTLNFDFGSDGPGSVSVASVTTPQVGVFLTTTIDGANITLSYGGTDYIKIIVDQTTGEYRVTQLAAIPHGAIQGENNFILNIEYRVTDKDGDTVIAKLDINIDDDTPTASNDFDSVANLQSTDGNVITGIGTSDPASGKDAVGADGAAVSAIVSVAEPANLPVATSDPVHGAGYVIDGEHGTLTIYADGYYVYTRSDSDPLIGDDKFTYTLTDGDFDSAQAILTINIYDEGTELDLEPDGENDNTVDEKGLPVRTINSVAEPVGTGEGADNDGGNDSDTSERAGGTMSFATPDGFGSLTLAGKDGPVVAGVGVTVHGLHGDLLITAFDGPGGTLSYIYTLLDNVDHSGGAVTDDFAVVVTDVDGDHSDDTLIIDIVDDAPIGVNDEYTVGEGLALNVPSAGVLANDISGADGGKVAVAAALIGSLGGSLTLNADGSFSYTAPASVDHDDAVPDYEIFTYTVKDADGSTSTAEIKINITDSGPAAVNDEYTVVEGTALTGKDVDANDNYGKDGPGQVTAAVLIGSLGGSLSLNADGTFSYTAPVRDHGVDGSDGDGADFETFTYEIKDSDGTSSTAQIKINITDTGASAQNDEYNVIEGKSLNVVAAGVLANDSVGADGGKAGVAAGLTGSLGGSLTLNADGSFSYTAPVRDHGIDASDGDGPDFETFIYTMRDADGSTSTAQIRINITDTGAVANPDEYNVVEGQTLNVPVAGVLLNDTVGADGGKAAVAAVLTGSLGGSLTLAADGSFSYTAPVRDHGVDGSDGDGADFETFTYTMKDADGSTSTAQIKINITDTGASAQNDEYNVVEGQGLNVTAAGVLANDTVGADGGKAAVATVLVGSLGGSLTLAADGSFSYTAPVRDHGVDGSDGDGADFETFTYTMKDADGSTSTAQIKINITDTGASAQNDEYAVVEGQTLNVPFVGVLVNDSVGADGGKTAVAAVLTGSLGGSLTLNADGSFSYMAPVRDHGADGSDGDGVDYETFTYTMKDADGSTSTAQIKINITDTAPLGGSSEALVDDDGLAGNALSAIGDDTQSPDPDSDEKTFSGTLAHTMNADGYGSVGFASLAGSTDTIGTELVSYGWASNTLTATITGGARNGSVLFEIVVTPATGAYTLTLKDNVLHAAGGDENNAAAALTYTVTDADGSTAIGILNISFDDDAPSAANDDGGTVNAGSTVAVNTVPAGVTGNDTFGADGAKSGGGVVGVIAGNNAGPSTSNVASEITGSLGKLTLNANGTYSYTANGNASGTDYFTYTIEDADGDRSTAVLSFNVADQAQGTITGSALVYEDGIADQNTGGTTATPEPLGISFTPNDNEQLTSLTLKALPIGWKIYDGASLLFTGAGVDVSIDTTVNLLANLTILPPTDNADGDISLNIEGALLDPTGGLTSAITGTLTVQRDAVADLPTNVQIIVTDSADGGSNFSSSETGAVQVKATFGDYLDGSEAHKITVQLATGFTAGLGASGTLGGYAYTYNSASGVVVLTVPNGTQSVDVTFAVTAPGGVIPANPTFTATATATETTFAGAEPDLTNNIATASASTGVPVERAISGTIITNSNVNKQQLVLTVVDQSNPVIAAANVFSLFLQGQQGTFLLDGGFIFDSDDKYGVAIESVVGSRDISVQNVQLTDFSLQIGAGVTTGDLTGSGNVKLDDNDDAAGPNLTGYTAVISPDTGAVDQALTGSVDGTAANQTLADGSANDGSFNMTYGAAGGDTLNGSNDADLLRGGPGADTLNGNGGNDILVFGAGDTINGGDGIDILRVDDGAIALTKIEDGSVAGPLINLLVDLEGQNIQNVESILITQEALPEAGFGTTIRLDAKNVLDFADDNGADANTLYIVGNSGDKLILGAPDAAEATWLDGDGNAGNGITKFASTTVGGVTFDEYRTSSGGTLFVDAEITVQTE